ncbi:inner membrane protein YhaH [Escherichia coli]|nr:inner membrane protein YhaH [Escherichia coli]
MSVGSTHHLEMVFVWKQNYILVDEYFFFCCTWIVNSALKNYVGFRGRARRKEYWMFILVNIIFTFVLGLLDKMLGWQRAGGEGILTTIYGILVFLPWWAVQFRRLHDTDRSAWWALLFLIPFIGWLIIIVFNCQAGTPGENRFGPDPKLEP